MLSEGNNVKFDLGWDGDECYAINLKFRKLMSNGCYDMALVLPLDGESE